MVAIAVALGGCTPVTPSPSPALTAAPPSEPSAASLEIDRNWETWCAPKAGCSLILEGPDGEAWGVSRAGGSERYSVMNGGMPKSLVPGDYKVSFHGAETVFIGIEFSSPTPYELEFECAAEFVVAPHHATVRVAIERADRRDCDVEVEA